MADAPRKRSRFDEEEPRRKTRFDKRSASPPAQAQDDSRRTRSPLNSPDAGGDGSKTGAAAAAAAAAARINASINAKKGVQHVDVPPVRPVSASILRQWTGH